MITFLYGAPGSGKTHYIFEKLREDPQEAILIVPEQQTVSAERKALDKLPSSSAVSFEVLNFSRLCNSVFRKYGGLSYHYITPSMKSLFMWRTLRELSPILEEYSAAAHDISLTDVMLRAAEELKVCAVTPTMLEGAAKKLPNGGLRSKLRDISLINSAYANLVAESFDDKSEDIAKLCDILEDHKFFEGKQVFIDSFTSFTAQEYRVIEHIFKQADSVTVALGCESPDMPLISNESICESAKRLSELANKTHQKSEKIFLSGNFRAKNKELLYLFSDFFKAERNKELSNIINEKDRGHVKLYSCLDPYEEADAVAAIINKEIRQGLRYRDIAIVARDASKYEGIIDAALESAGIPYYMSVSKDLSSSPAVEFLLSAIRIKYFGFRSDDVISHIKTGMCRVTLSDADMFETYINTWGISGKRFEEDGWSMNPDGYTRELTERGKKILSAANSVKARLTDELTGFFVALDTAENVKEMVTAIYSYLVSSRLDEALKRAADAELERGNKRAAADHISTWNVIIDILDDINTALGDESLGVDELYRALVLSFKNADIGSIPTGYDEVTIGSASIIRADNVKCAILIGLNEGEFPASVNENGIFTDTDRAALKDKGIELSSDSKGRAAEELVFANRAITLPSDKLYMLYTKTSSGGAKLRPSMLVNRMLSFFDYIKAESFPVEEMIFNTESAKEKLPLICNEISKRALCEELDKRKVDRSPMLISETECTVSNDTAISLFGDRMALTQSKIDKFVGCHFGYYCNYVLGLRPEEKATVDSRVSGTFVHAVLEKFIKGAVTESGIDTDRLEETVDSVIEELIGSICTGEQKNSNRLRHLFMRLRRLSLVLISCLKEEFEKSKFRPEFFELKIGTNGITPIKLTLSDGTEVSLYGTVDRVDIWKNEGEVYIRVVDYKTGATEFSLSDVKKGLNLQLLIYLFTLCRPDTNFAKSIGCADGKAPVAAGANYLSSKISIEKYSYMPSSEAVLSDAKGRIDRSGFSLDSEVLDTARERPKKGLMSSDEIAELKSDFESTVVAIADAMKSGDASAKPLSGEDSPCKYCKMASVCRNPEKTYN